MIIDTDVLIGYLRGNQKARDIVDKEISSRAMFYIQEYALSHSMMLADALIAAIVVQSNEKLITANDKHYKFIPTIECKKFSPGEK